MKITYPECQIEISVEEIITLIDHANLTDAGTRLVKEIEHIKEDLPEEPALSDIEQATEEVNNQVLDPLEGVDFEEPEPQGTPMATKKKQEYMNIN